MRCHQTRRKQLKLWLLSDGAGFRLHSMCQCDPVRFLRDGELLPWGVGDTLQANAVPNSTPRASPEPYAAGRSMLAAIALRCYNSATPRAGPPLETAGEGRRVARVALRVPASQRSRRAGSGAHLGSPVRGRSRGGTSRNASGRSREGT